MIGSRRNDAAINEKLLSILDHLIEGDCWDKSLFLQAAGREVTTLRDRLQTTLELPEPTETEETLASSSRSSSVKSADSQQEVYVALYQAQGSNMLNWEHALDFLLSRSSSRPIYDTEEKVKNMMIKKENTPNNAYAVVSIDKSDVLFTPEKQVFDRYGQELLTLREHALKADNIRRFVHSTGTYRLEKRHLIKQK
ncbi:MAG: Dot/Icm secretion system protein IcmQ [Gammaproteobacteria bacterium]|nr:Dot/Icm secretion system protein IcmQ [Gammaproteobacteria bacterium]